MSVFILVMYTMGTVYVAPVNTRLTTVLLSMQDNRACRPDLEPVMNERM